MWPQNGQYTDCSVTAPAAPDLLFAVYGKAATELENLAPHPLHHGVRTLRIQHVGDEVRNLLDFALLEAPRRRGWSTDPKAARDRRRARIVRHGVLVHRDVGFAERGIGLLSGDGAADEA